MDAAAAVGNCNALSTLAILTSSTVFRSSRACSKARPSNTRLLAAASQDAPSGEVAAAEGEVDAAAPASSVEALPQVTDLLRSSALETPSISLISYANIQKALKGEALSTPDHYAILGLATAASYQEVETAFRTKCEILLQQGLSEEEIQKRLRVLKASYDVLSSAEERRLYDWSLLQLNMEGAYSWPFEADITQSECDPAPPQRPVDEEGIRKVRNFFIGWLVLSVVLNLVLR